MTALCPGGGTSSPKPGHAAVVQYSAGLLASIFAAYDLSWLIPVIPLLSFANQVLATFCASDPPAVVALTSAESSALLNLTFGPDFDSGLTKVTNLYLNVVWHDACQCDSGTATAFTPPAAPAGTPIFQPPVPGTATPCVEQDWTSPFQFNGDALPLLFLHFPTQNVTSFNCVMTNVATVAPGSTLTFTIGQGAVFNDFSLRSDTFTVAVGVPQTAVIPRVSGAYFLNVNVHPANPGSGRSAAPNSLFQAYCDGGAAGQTIQPCCPPDTATQAYLDVMTRQLNLIQRQLVPFAYIASTAHAGLSGAGSFSIQGLLGVKVNVTTLPSQIGQEGTSPAEYFDMGFLTFGTPDGYGHAVRLERSQQIILPARCSAFTSFAYDLHPGVVCTVTELVREP